jgi:thiosulfate dehydrogenase [quinone] large subunit
MRHDVRMPKRHRGTVRPARTYPGVGAPATTQPRGRAQQAAAVAADRRIGLAMLPLRLFLGLTFVYAGLDKVLFDPTFLDSAAPTSLLAQLQGFAHTSPLAPLITLIAEPLVGPIGLAMAIAEIAVGLGALTGLLPRASAWGGFAIAVLLWLTASFAIHPYYLGPDLPYAAGWLTLALVGDGDVYTIRAGMSRWLVGLGLEEPDADPERRRFIQGALLGGVAILTGGFGWLLGEPGRSSLTAELQARPTPSPTPIPSGPAATPKGAIGTLASLRQQGSIDFQIPLQASSFAGDPAVVVLLSDGTAVAYDAVCTHAGCTVGFDPSSSDLFCPCHGATFDPKNHGAVLGGPTNIPLPEVPIHVDAQTGVITLAS